MKEKIKKILWISGRCGYGKTELADSIAQEGRMRHPYDWLIPGINRL